MLADQESRRTVLAKQTLRESALTARTRRDQATYETTTAQLRDQLLELPEVGAATVVAAYCATGAEPGTHAFLEALAGRGTTILVPVMRADLDLDWAPYVVGAVRPGRFGILEPTGQRLGVEAISTADVAICPGVAGDRSGGRLGRGGGSFDRALARLPSATLRCLLLYDDEVVTQVPTQGHDEPVDVLVTPNQIIRTSLITRADRHS